MNPLDEADIDKLLREIGYGFLGLARNDNSYVIPISFGYDGDGLYFQMNSAGRKFEYIEDNSSTMFAVLGINQDTGISKSVLVEGELCEIPEDDEMSAYEALAANAMFGTDLEVWGNPLQEEDLTHLKLLPANITGRAFGENML